MSRTSLFPQKSNAASHEFPCRTELTSVLLLGRCHSGPDVQPASLMTSGAPESYLSSISERGQETESAQVMGKD